MGLVVSNPGQQTANCNFYKQLEYPGNIVIKMYVSDPAGGATTIWVDFPKQKAITMPDKMRALVS
jgi:acyl-CoA thioester hydrolase